MATAPSFEKSIDQLNSFLRGELSAVETYQQALAKVQEQEVISRLRECLQSHQQRVQLLRQRVVQLGGIPSTDSGAWGVFAKLVEGSAAVLGDKAAISALEEGEDRGLRDYKTGLDDLDADSRRIIEQQVLPAEQETHRTMSTLKHSLQQRM